MKRKLYKRNQLIAKLALLLEHLIFRATCQEPLPFYDEIERWFIGFFDKSSTKVFFLIKQKKVHSMPLYLKFDAFCMATKGTFAEVQTLNLIFVGFQA